jgi:hypothetical protein
MSLGQDWKTVKLKDAGSWFSANFSKAGWSKYWMPRLTTASVNARHTTLGPVGLVMGVLACLGMFTQLEMHHGSCC